MKKVFYSIFIGVFSVYAFYLATNYFNPSSKASDHSKIGWITDIHAGDKKDIEREPGNIVYPRSFRVYFPVALEGMKSKGISTVIVTGDVVNRGSEYKQYKTELENIAASYSMRIIWVNGNHDDYSHPLYYSLDYGNWKIIVLDSNQANDPKGTGGIDDKQMKWLIGEIDNSNRPILLAMHHTIFDKINHGLYSEYTEFKNIIDNKQKVRMVISGHLHNEHFQEQEGIKYFSGDPLNRDYRLNYYIIDFNSLSVESYHH